MKKMDKKAFTLIELLVVVAVIGILVLLAAPRFIGYTQRAEDARIHHDIKVMEQEVGAVLSNNEDDFNKWEDNSKDLNQLVEEKELFEKESHAERLENGPYKIIPEKYKDKINTKLKGTFYANSGGKVYYKHVKSLSGISTGPEKEPKYSDEEINDLKNKGFIPVATAEDLNSIKDGLGKQYIQVANIDLSGYDGWNPIGDSLSGFKGTYDGGNYVITGLVVKGEGKNNQGLFGYTDGATIRNVGLIDNKVTGGDNVGGLVGYVDRGTTISNSYATGSVTGGDNVGGLVGWAHHSTIGTSYVTGKVTGSLGVGGLVGYSTKNTISNSYATGSVTGSEVVGGLVGNAHLSTNIFYSYATGKVTGSSRVGGLEGVAKGIIRMNSYWDRETTGQTTSGGIGNGNTTAEMKTADTYSKWRTDVWNIVNGEYPTLR